MTTKNLTTNMLLLLHPRPSTAGIAFLLLQLMLLLTACSGTDNTLLNSAQDMVADTATCIPFEPANYFDKVKLRAELEAVYDSDQGIRKKYLDLEKQYGRNSKEVMAITSEWRNIDSVNGIKITDILDQFGWLGAGEVGRKGNAALFLVIQHSDLKIQDKYLPLMRQAVKEKNAEAKELALLEDRVLIDHGKKQRFGSQVELDPVSGKYRLSPIEDEPNVNQRRAAVGLEPLEEYAKSWNIRYVLPKSPVKAR